MIPNTNLTLNILVLAITFIVLTKSADYLVDGAVGIAEKFKLPKLFIGVVLVGFGTTTPEFIVSLLAALRGEPEIALGNALGSIAADDGVALAMAILFAPTIIVIPERFLKTSGIFLICISVMSFFLARNGEISRIAGGVHLLLLVVYLFAVLRSEKKRRDGGGDHLIEEEDDEIEDHIKKGSTKKQVMTFLTGLAGVIIASHFLVESAVNIAKTLAVPEMLIGMTMVAVGTSLPEIATCISAARKGHGDLAFGDIIGADILNLLWIIGGAAVVAPITVEKEAISFAYPATLCFIFGMLIMARLGYKLHKWKAVVLLVGYMIYLPLAYTILGKKKLTNSDKPTVQIEDSSPLESTVPTPE